MFEDEIHPELKHTGAGVVSMANSGPNSNGSQYFVTLAPCQWLDGTFYVFESCRFYSCVAKSLREVSKYGVFLVHIFLYSVRIQENADGKKLRLWTLFIEKSTGGKYV